MKVLHSLAVLCLALTVVPACAQLYDNGPLNGNVNAWEINNGSIISDSFTCCRYGPTGTVGGFDFYVWAIHGDTPLTVDWSITSQPNGGIVYGGGTAKLIDNLISTNSYGYDIFNETTSGLYVTVGVGSGTYWLNLQNATTTDGDPLYWDENSGVGCMSPGCPSQASSNMVGTIPSESFTIRGATPELGSGVLLGSGMLVLAGAMRRKLKF
jgi:hypothetical protein